ncbi:LysR family transcriptional regulator [Catenovulum sp. SM1970]|uniref:LysR family transcriptional regulator n=1 Tax=Marinifaba aquimaris TaxID=2741323 RepID=UPI00157338C4|nr:LysR family transcriptional regulator [Marinifaba aquimaris]NTS76187.1 LysR family transcriptional regulator [Marinifaba aquimaris]
MNTIKLAPLLLIFAEVAKLGSFTLAAKKLSSSKSAISQQIKRLESELDMQLIARNTRGLVLTPMGEALLARSELLSEQLAYVVNDIKNAKTQPSGQFKISVPPFFERNIIVPALRQFCLEYPLIEPELTVTGRWQDLIEHQLDVAIFGGKLKDSNYKAQYIGEVRDLFCATANYVQQHGRPESIDALASHHYIASSWQKQQLMMIDKTTKVEQTLEIAHSLSTNNLPTLVEMVLSDMGVALVPEFIAKREVNRGNLVHLLPNYHSRPWHFYFLHRYQEAKPQYVERFYQLVKHYFLKNGD